MMNSNSYRLAAAGVVLLYSGILTSIQADPGRAAFDRDIWGPLAPLVRQNEPQQQINQNTNEADDPNELIDTLILQDLFPDDVPPPDVAEPIEPEPEPEPIPQLEPIPDPEPEPLPQPEPDPEPDPYYPPDPQPAPEPRLPEDPWAPQPPPAEPPPDPWAPQPPPPPPPPSREPRFPTDPWAPDPRPDPWAPPPRPADPWTPQAGRWTWSAFFAAAFGDREGELYTGHLSIERLVWYNWSFALQPFGGIGVGRDDSAGVLGLDTIFKYPFYVSGPTRFNFEGGVGFQQSGPKSWPDDGTHYNFRGLLGAGMEFDTARFQRLLFGARWLHINNLGIDSDRNPKVDNIMLYGGWQFRF